MSMDVLIIGGGLAGLAAAVELAPRGLRVAVLEEDGVLGGRARSWTDRHTGDTVHIGPHILLSAYPNMLRLLDGLGTQQHILWLKDSFIPLVEGQTRHEVRASRLPPPLQFLPSMMRDPWVSRADLLTNVRVTVAALRLTEADVQQLDCENAYGYLRRMGVSTRLIERFWAFVAMSILNVPLELCSAGALMRFYRDMTGHRDTHIGLPAVGLSDLFVPGACRIVESHGGEVRTGTRVSGLLLEGQGAVGVRLADGSSLRAQYVIAALPPQALRRLIPTDHRNLAPFADLARFEPCPYVSTYLWFDRKLTSLPFWARVHSPHDLNCDFYDFSNIDAADRARGPETDRPSRIGSNIIYARRAQDLSDDEIVAATREEIAQYLPDARKAEVVHSVVNRIPMAIHCPYPGTEQRRPPPETPFANFWLAGDWIATGVPACMESAVQSGYMAAERVLRASGQPVALTLPQAPLAGFAGLVHRTPRTLRRVA
jgi:15-cis-phytoene desaturase